MDEKRRFTGVEATHDVTYLAGLRPQTSFQNTLYHIACGAALFWFRSGTARALSTDASGYKVLSQRGETC